MTNPVRQCAEVRHQCASALVKVSAPVRQRPYRAHAAHTHHTTDIQKPNQCANNTQRKALQMADFPLLDADYTAATTDLNRTVLNTLDPIEPAIDETDTYCTIPIRLVHDTAAGLHLELGPYTIDHTDIERLRNAIHAYDLANHGPTLRRVK